MQRRLRNTLAIAIAGGAVILGAGTAFAASPADDVTGSTTDQVGSVTKNAPSTDGLSTDELSSATPDVGSATDSLPTKDLGKGVKAPGLGGLGT
jgi:hypothetical protein